MNKISWGMPYEDVGTDPHQSTRTGLLHVQHHGIGPHEGREWGLMILRRKPAAILSDRQFLPLKEVADMLEFRYDLVTMLQPGFDEWVVAAHGEEWRIEAIRRTLKRARERMISMDRYHVMMGHFLGYIKADIRAFLAPRSGRRAVVWAPIEVGRSPTFRHIPDHSRNEGQSFRRPFHRGGLFYNPSE